jgi:hypothetical protein
MKKLILLILISAFSAAAQQEETPKYTLYTGLSLNPWLMAKYRHTELGPVFILSRRLGGHWSAGIGCLSRNLWTFTKKGMNKDFGLWENLAYPYNIENLYFVQGGYHFRGRRLSHALYLNAGVRHELFYEKVHNPAVGIMEETRLSEMNFMCALSYAFRCQLKENRHLVLRLMLPFNREPFDDVNRYSLELGYEFPLLKKRKDRS